MDLQVHQDKKVTQVAMENLEMMAILAYLDVMAHLESATIDQESLLGLVSMDLQENQ